MNQMPAQAFVSDESPTTFLVPIGPFTRRMFAEAMRTLVALDPDDSSRKEILIGIFKKTSRVDGDAEAELVIHQIAHDHRVAVVEVLRSTVLQVSCSVET